MTSDVESYHAVAPLLRDPARIDGGRARKKPPWPVLIVVLVAHVAAVDWAMHTRISKHRIAADAPIAVRLVELPKPPSHMPTPAAPVAVRRAQPPRKSVAEIVAPPPVTPAAPDVVIFNSDGSLKLPPEEKSKIGFPETDVAKGRELMGRGLDCEAPDALGTGESLGESTARKYLSWIGLYNPYSAQHRAELAAERQARCQHWREQR